MADDKNRNTVQQYVGDMLALENHIEEPLKSQLTEVNDYPEALQAVQSFHSMVQSHQQMLKSHLESIGGSESSPIKSAVSGIFGFAAGVIDKIRTKSISKALRDDYTAFNLAAIGYGMLYTTAKLLGEPQTAALAESHLRDYTRAVKQIEDILPGVVAWELRKEGNTFEQSAVDDATRLLYEAWREAGTSNERMGGSTSESFNRSTSTSNF